MCFNPLAGILARRLRRASDDVDDLAHDGILGLLADFAASDPERAAFETFAHGRTRSAILDARDCDAGVATIRRGDVGRLREHRRAAERLTRRSGRPATFGEAADALGWPARRRAACRRALALAPRGRQGGEAESSDVMARLSGPISTTPVNPLERERSLREPAPLRPRPRTVMAARPGQAPFDRPHTLDEIRILLGVTKQRAKQPGDEALRLLRRRVGGDAVVAEGSLAELASPDGRGRRAR